MAALSHVSTSSRRSTMLWLASSLWEAEDKLRRKRQGKALHTLGNQCQKAVTSPAPHGTPGGTRKVPDDMLKEEAGWLWHVIITQGLGLDPSP